MKTEHNENLFDRLMGLPVLRIFNPFYLAHKEALLYLFFGGLTTLVDLVIFFVCTGLHIHTLITNVIAWGGAVLFAYFTNRSWVFHARTEDKKEGLRQIFSFFAGRLFSLGTEEAFLAVFITWLKLPTFWVKSAAQIVVVILNYIISKLIVFRKKKAD